MGRASEGPLSAHRDPTLARGNDGRTFRASWKAGLGRTPAVLRRLKGTAARSLRQKAAASGLRQCNIGVVPLSS